MKFAKKPEDVIVDKGNRHLARSKQVFTNHIPPFETVTQTPILNITSDQNCIQKVEARSKKEPPEQKPKRTKRVEKKGTGASLFKIVLGLTMVILLVVGLRLNKIRIDNEDEIRQSIMWRRAEERRAKEAYARSHPSIIDKTPSTPSTTPYCRKVTIYKDEREARLLTYTLIHDEESRGILLRDLPDLLKKSSNPTDRLGRLQKRSISLTQEARNSLIGYLDDGTKRCFQDTPTLVLVESNNFFKLISEGNEPESAHYHPGTNIIIISMDAFIKRDITETLVHEHLHLLAELGGTRGYTFPSWLDEGFTEMYTYYVTNSTTSWISYSTGYSTETTVALYLHHLLDEKLDPSWHAYLTGRTSEMETEIDSKLGVGSFDGLVRNITPEAGWRYTRRKMRENGINYAEWERTDRYLRRIGRHNLIE